jgi:hypothetical protein
MFGFSERLEGVTVTPRETCKETLKRLKGHVWCPLLTGISLVGEGCTE